MVSYLSFTFNLSKFKTMKTLLLILSIAAFASCSTAYKSGQTPDDLYYSKSKVIVEKESENRYERRQDYTSEDRQIRMAIHDPRWRNLDYDYDYDCHYSPYAYGYNYGYYYNPFYYPYPVYTGGVKYVNPKNTTIRTANLGAYSNTVTTYTPTKGYGTVKTIAIRGYNNSNTQNTRTTNNETRTYTEPRSETRTYSPAPSNNSSNSNSSTPAQGTSVTMPGRGGN
jgi:hypothetical protein